MANVGETPELGEEELSTGSRSGLETQEVPSDDGEPHSVERTNRGGSDGTTADSQADSRVAGDVPGLQYLGEWPFRIVKDDEDLLVFGEWAQNLGAAVDKTPVGLSCTQSELAFATSEMGWLIPFASFSDVTKGMLKRILFSERGSPAFVVRGTMLVRLHLRDWFDADVDNILLNIIHDMRCLEYTTGRPVASSLTTLKDALDCAVVGPTMALEASSFYREVALPVAKHRIIDSTLDLDNTTKWSVTYDWLLFKVLAHLTHDPTLTRWFQDGDNPLKAFGTATGLETKEASAFLLWMVCGEDESLLSQKHPDWAALMPKNPQLIKAQYVDKNLPNLRLGLTRLIDQFASRRRSSTMYNRASTWGMTPQELLYFSIMGSVDDILDVMSASLIKMGSDNHFLSHDTYDRWNRAVIVGYTDLEPMQWEEDVAQLAKLNDPLGLIGLEPKVVTYE